MQPWPPLEFLCLQLYGDRLESHRTGARISLRTNEVGSLTAWNDIFRLQSNASLADTLICSTILLFKPSNMLVEYNGAG